MARVTRDKRKYGVPSVFGDTTENLKRQAKEREEARAEEIRMDNEARGYGNEFYHTGRVRPLIDEDN